MNPGNKVIPFSSMISVPAGNLNIIAPACSILLLFTNTTQSLCIVSPSKTRSGFSKIYLSDGWEKEKLI